MLETKIFTTNPIEISANSFYPRNYSPSYLFVKNIMKNYPTIDSFITKKITSGSTPPAYLFKEKNEGIPFVKTSAILRHFINMNDLHYIDEKFHKTSIKRSIAKPYDVIYSMTGKFMGKAALCPPVVAELNMSQNSVLLSTDSPLKSAFLAIFLNSEINRIQVKGEYSITKQKYINQGKIAKLRVVPYEKKYDHLLEDYINMLERYYSAVTDIGSLIHKFDSEQGFSFNTSAMFGYTVNPTKFEKKILLPNFYRPDVVESIDKFGDNISFNLLEESNIRKGDEIGSKNYLEQGIPFIKTSDIANFDIDNEPNCYCAPAFINQLNQDIKKGDIIFTKDGKPGEVAIIEETANIVISSGLVKYHPRNEEELYHIFLLLASKYGKAYFKKWFVIASTMTHLRKDFFNDFKIPEINEEIRINYIYPLKKAFEEKKNCYDTIMKIRDEVINGFMTENAQSKSV